MPDPDDIEDLDPETETVEANRSIEQGGGFGARELGAQRDPGRDYLPEIVADEQAEGSVEGVQQGRTNTNRELDDASDDIQGEDTTEANRDIVRGVQDMNP